MRRAKKSRVVGGERLVRLVRWFVAVSLVVAAFTVHDVRADDGPRIDLNSASVAELTTLPGVGPAKAQAIVDYRETAPFKSPEELVQVKGIGEKLYDQLKDRVMVGEKPQRAVAGSANSGGGAARTKTGRTATASSAR